MSVTHYICKYTPVELLRAFGAPLSCLIRLLYSRVISMTQQGGLAIFMAPSSILTESMV